MNGKNAQKLQVIGSDNIINFILNVWDRCDNMST